MNLFFFTLSSSILAINTVAYAAAAAAAAGAAADWQSGRYALASMPKSYGLGIERRQETECLKVEPGPSFCKRSCGPLFTACVVEDSCYLPSLGQTCCANAAYCPAGTYCSTLGCCINGSSLEDCAADLTSGNTAIISSVPGTFFATSPATLVVTNSVVATSSHLKTSPVIASSNSAVSTLSFPSVSSPTSAAATPSVSTSLNPQTSKSISNIPSNTQTATATLTGTTSSATPTSNSGSKNSEDIIGLVSALLGFLLIL